MSKVFRLDKPIIRLLKKINNEQFKELKSELYSLNSSRGDAEDIFQNENYKYGRIISQLIAYAGSVDSIFEGGFANLVGSLDTLYRLAHNIDASKAKTRIGKADSAYHVIDVWSPYLVFDGDDPEEFEVEDLSMKNDVVIMDDGTERSKDDEEVGENDFYGFADIETGEGLGLEEEYLEVVRKQIDQNLVVKAAAEIAEVQALSDQELISKLTDIVESIQDEIVVYKERYQLNNSFLPNPSLIDLDYSFRAVANGISEDAKSDEGDSGGNITYEEVDADKSSGSNIEYTEEPIPADTDNKVIKSKSLESKIREKSLIDISITDSESKLLSEISDSTYGYDGVSAGGSYDATIIQKTHIDREKSLKLIKKNYESGSLEGKIFSHFVDINSNSEDVKNNKSLVHPIFQSAMERFGWISIVYSDNQSLLIRDDAGDMLEYLLAEINSFIENLYNFMQRKRIPNSERGTAEFEMMVEKISISASNLIEAAKVWDYENEKHNIVIDSKYNLINRIKLYSIGDDVSIVKSLEKILRSGLLASRLSPSKEKDIQYLADKAGLDRERFREDFIMHFENQVEFKIKNILDKYDEDAWSHPIPLLHAAENFSMDLIKKETRKTAGYGKIYSNYINCPVCNKNISYEMASARMGGSKSDKIRSDYDFSIREYSLIRRSKTVSEDGVSTYYPEEIISKRDLLDHPGVVISTNAGDELIRWVDAEDLSYSASIEEQQNGIIAKNKILEALGGEPISSSDAYISSKRFFCPMKNMGVQLGSPTVGECGFSANISGGYGDTDISITSKFTHPDLEMDQDALEALDGLDISEIKKSEILKSIERKRAGGWKFSNKFLACPCHVSPDSLDNDGLRSFSKKYINSSFLVMPHIGFAKKSLLNDSGIISIDEEGKVTVSDDNVGKNKLNWIYQPPTTPSGENKYFENGMSSYVVCGATTSVSSFIRDKSNSLSIQSLVSKIRDRDPEKSRKFAVIRVVRAMLEMGVDPSDLLTVDGLFDDESEKASRAEELSELLKFAMAIKLDKGGDDSIMEVLGDLGLRCGNGHTFTIGQYARFSSTHAGVKAGKSILSNPTLLGSSGIENFSFTKEKYFRDIRSLSDERSLKNALDTGSSYSGFSTLKIKFPSPDGSGNFLSFSRSGNIRSRVFMTASAGTGNAPPLTIFSPMTKVDKSTRKWQYEGPRGGLGRASFGHTEEGSSADAGDAAVMKSSGAKLSDVEDQLNERLDASKAPDTKGLIINILELFENSLNAIVSLRKTSQSINMESVLVNDDRECCENLKMEIGPIIRGVFNEINLDPSFSSMAIDYIDDAFRSNNGSRPKISSLRAYGRAGLINMVNRLITRSVPIGLSIEQDQVQLISNGATKIVDILVPRGYVYDDLFPEDVGAGKSRKNIVLRRRSEHVGRQIMGGSALYIAEVMSSIYRERFSSNNFSRLYSGLDIGIDLSSAEKVMNIEFEDISVISPKVNQDYSNKLLDNFQKNLGDINNLAKSFIYAKNMITKEMVNFRGIVTTEKYLRAGADIASRPFFQNDAFDTDEVAQNVRKYIFGNDTIIDMSLNRGSKHVAGLKSRELIGSYTSPILEQNHKVGNSGLIHLVATGGKVSIVNNDLELFEDDFINDFKGSKYFNNYHMALARRSSDGSLPYGCIELPDDLYAQVDIAVTDSGWVPCLVAKMIDGKEAYKVKPKYKLSMADHPYTETVRSDGKIHYRNSNLNIDTKSGIHLGQQTAYTGNSGVLAVYPPSPYAPTNTGIMIPFDYKGTVPRAGSFALGAKFTIMQDDTDEYKSPKYRIPIQECNIPIDIGPSVGIINAANFMKRSPKYAVLIFNEIDKIYGEYVLEVNRAGAESKSEIERVAKKRIMQLHNRYRSLQYEVEVGKNRTMINPKGGVTPCGGLYVPMWDYKIIYKMATWTPYSKDWGGPGGYATADEIDDIIKFISNLYNIDGIRNFVNNKLGKSYSAQEIIDGAIDFDGDIRLKDISNNPGKFYEVISNEEVADSGPGIKVYTDWDYPGVSHIDSESELQVHDYSTRLNKLRMTASSNEEFFDVRLSPSDVATLAGLYAAPADSNKKLSMGPFGGTRDLDPNMSIYAFTGKLRDFLLRFSSEEESGIKRLSSQGVYSGKNKKLSERKISMRRIIQLAEVESLLDILR